MRAVVQRVKRASVTVDGEVVSSIGEGLLVLLGVAAGDDERDAEYLADKVANRANLRRVVVDAFVQRGRQAVEVGQLADDGHVPPAAAGLVVDAVLPDAPDVGRGLAHLRPHREPRVIDRVVGDRRAPQPEAQPVLQAAEGLVLGDEFGQLRPDLLADHAGPIP